MNVRGVVDEPGDYPETAERREAPVVV